MPLTNRGSLFDKLVLEGKTGKEIPDSSRLEFLEKFSANKQFFFIRCGRQHLWAVEQRRYSRFTFVKNSVGNLPKVPKAKFLGSDGHLFYYHMQVWQLQEPFCNDF